MVVVVVAPPVVVVLELDVGIGVSGRTYTGTKYLHARGGGGSSSRGSRGPEGNGIVDEVGAQESITGAARNDVDGDGVGAGDQDTGWDRDFVDDIVATVGTTSEATAVELYKQLSAHLASR